MRELRGRTHGPRRQRVTELSLPPVCARAAIGRCARIRKVDANSLRQIFPLGSRPATGRGGGAKNDAGRLVSRTDSLVALALSLP